MQFDELKRAWDEYDRKLETRSQLNTRLVQSSIFGKTERPLKRLSQLLSAELLLCVVAAVWLLWSVWHRAAESLFLVPAAALDMCAIALVIAAIRQIASVSRIDYSAPVVATQKQLESMRIERMRTTKWALLLAPPAWTPFVVVAMKSLFDVSVFGVFGTSWFAISLVFSLLVIAAGIRVSKRYATSINRSSLLQRLMQDIAGQNLTAAAGFVRSISEWDGGETTRGIHAATDRFLRRRRVLRG
jgi:hypothetical protein